MLPWAWWLYVNLTARKIVQSYIKEIYWVTKLYKILHSISQTWGKLYGKWSQSSMLLIRLKLTQRLLKIRMVRLESKRAFKFLLALKPCMGSLQMSVYIWNGLTVCQSIDWQPCCSVSKYDLFACLVTVESGCRCMLLSHTHTLTNPPSVSQIGMRSEVYAWYQVISCSSQ